MPARSDEESAVTVELRDASHPDFTASTTSRLADGAGTTDVINREPVPRPPTFVLLPDEELLSPTALENDPALEAEVQNHSDSEEEAASLLVLPDTCCWCIPLKAGVQVVTSFDMITAIYNVGHEVQSLQWYDSPSVIAQLINPSGDQDPTGFYTRKGNRAMYLAQLIWSVILLVNACLGFVGVGKNVLALVRTYTVIFALSIAVEFTQAAKATLYHERWREPLNALDVSINFLWALIRVFVWYHVYFWYRTLKAYYERVDYESGARLARIVRRLTQAVGLGNPIAAAGAAEHDSGAARRRARFRRVWRRRRGRPSADGEGPSAASSGLEMLDR